MRTIGVFLSLCFLLMLAPGCGGGDDGPGVASVALTAEGASNGDAPCPREREVCMTFQARDEGGALVALDPSEIEWRLDNTSEFTLGDCGTGQTVTALRDWFDGTSAEPSGNVSACFDGHCASLAVQGVIDATGAWVAELDNGLTFTLNLTQQGRTVTESNYLYTGTVVNNTLALTIEGFQVNATFVSRSEVTGTYTGPGGLVGTLICRRQ